MDRIVRRLSTTPLALAVLFLAIGASWIAGVSTAFLSPWLAVGGLGLLGLLLFGAAKPELAVLGLLLLRSYADQVEAMAVPVLGIGRVFNVGGLITLLLLALGVVHVVKHRLRPLRQPLVQPMVGMTLVAGLTMLVSWDRGTTLVVVLRLASYLAVYVVVADVVKTRRQAARLAVVLLLAGLITVGAGAVQVATGTEDRLRGTEYYRLGGAFDSGVAFGNFLLLPMLASFALLRHGRRSQRILCALLVAVYAVALYHSFARASWAGLLVGLAVMAGFRGHRNLLIAVVAIVIVGSLLPGVALRVQDALRSPAGGTLRGRFEIWQGALMLFRQSPVLGVGMGVGHLWAGYLATGEPLATHNDYLRMLADGGIVGLVAFLWLNLAVGFQALKVSTRLRVPVLRSLAVAFVAVWAAYLVVRLTSNVFAHSIIEYPFFAFAGLVQALPGVQSEGERGDGSAVHQEP
jgi:O-antigen ligase